MLIPPPVVVGRPSQAPKGLHGAQAITAIEVLQHFCSNAVLLLLQLVKFGWAGGVSPPRPVTNPLWMS